LPQELIFNAYILQKPWLLSKIFTEKPMHWQEKNIETIFFRMNKKYLELKDGV